MFISLFELSKCVWGIIQYKLLIQQPLPYYIQIKSIWTPIYYEQNFAHWEHSFYNWNLHIYISVNQWPRILEDKVIFFNQYMCPTICCLMCHFHCQNLEGVITSYHNIMYSFNQWYSEPLSLHGLCWLQRQQVQSLQKHEQTGRHSAFLYTVHKTN